MSKYKVEEVTVKKLILDSNYSNNVLRTVDCKQVVGNQFPSLSGSTFVYERVNRYRFGCGTGLFTYEALLDNIKQAEDAGAKKVVEGLKPKKGGNVVTKAIIEESDSYYIVEGGKAYSKDKYTKDKVDVTGKEASFGGFTYHAGGSYYRAYYTWKGNTAGSTRAEILEAMYQAKTIIDFLEDRGEYAPKVDNSTEVKEAK